MKSVTNLRPRTKILIIVLLTCTAAVSFTYESILRQIGYFLVFEQKPQKADVIVVLNGRDTERALAAVDLYKQGYANLIVMARGPKQPGCDEFFRRVGSNWNRKVFFQRSVEAMGIPDHSFKYIGSGVTSTHDEAQVARNFLQNAGYKSVLIVTSKWHSRRAYLTFKRILRGDQDITIILSPAKYDTFDPNIWWKSETTAELVFKEYVRLIYYAIKHRISPFA